MTALRTSQPALPRILTDHLLWSREGFDFLAGELDHAIELLDAGQAAQARAVLAEALRVMDREMARH
jgi:soluble cytochrome b562